MTINANQILTPDNVQFYLNPSFAIQAAHPVGDLTETDKYGLIAIPGKFDFWMIMMNNQIYVINSRRTID